MIRLSFFAGTVALSLAAFAPANTVFAQCGKSWDAYPKGAEEAQRDHVRYKDLLKAKKYAEAYPIWYDLFQTVKTPKENGMVHFLDGATLCFELMKTEQDAKKKADMLAMMISLYEDNVKCNGERPDDRGYQGYRMYYHDADLATTMKVFERAMELQKDNFFDFNMSPMASVGVQLFLKNTAGYDGEYMRKLYQRMQSLAEAQSKGAKADKYKAGWEKVQKEFAQIETKIFDCTYFVGKYKPLYEKDKQNMPQNEQFLSDLIKKAKCTETDAFVQELESVLKPYREAQRKAKEDSLFNCCLNNLERGAVLESRGDKEKAQEYYIKALEDPAVSNQDKGTTAYRLAYTYYSANNFGTARSYCRKASTFRPDWGEPYMLVGQMYASSGRLCGPGTGWDSQVVVWAALDEWIKAKSVDPSIADKANEMINRYSAYLPTVEDGHERQIGNGASYTVGCWIQTTTTVRLRKN